MARELSRISILRRSCRISIGRHSSRHGSLPAAIRKSSTDNKVGAEAKKLFDDAQALLKRMVAEKWVTASGVVGFWPANSIGDDIELYADDKRGAKLATLHTLRQQIARDPSRNRAHVALADFIAPKETGVADYVGAFAVTAGLGEEEAIERHIKKTDDYNRIMAKALCDRLAEAFAEAMHAEGPQGALGLCERPRSFRTKT